jgi:hypothetical protein
MVVHNEVGELNEDYDPRQHQVWLVRSIRMTAATSSISRPPGKLFTEDLDLAPTMIHADCEIVPRSHHDRIF